MSGIEGLRNNHIENSERMIIHKSEIGLGREPTQKPESSQEIADRISTIASVIQRGLQNMGEVVEKSSDLELDNLENTLTKIDNQKAELRDKIKATKE